MCKSYETQEPYPGFSSFLSQIQSKTKKVKSRNMIQKMQGFKQNELECHVASTESKEL